MDLTEEKNGCKTVATLLRLSINCINCMKKMGMQRNNNEAMRQKFNSHTFVDDIDFFFYNRPHSSLRRCPQTITQLRKQTFSNSLDCFCNCFLVCRKEFSENDCICISQTELYVIFSINSEERENNLASDPICVWLMSLYGYWLRILYAYQQVFFFKSRSSLAKYISLRSDRVAEWLVVFFLRKSTALFELQFESVK